MREDDHDDEERCSDAFDGRRHFLIALVDGLPLRNHAHFEIRPLRTLASFGDALQRALDDLEGRAAPLAEELELLLHVLARRGCRQLAGDGVQLLVDPPAAESEGDGRQSERKRDGAGAAQERSLEPKHDRREEKREQHRQRDGHDDRPREMEHRDDDDRAEEDARVRLAPVGGALVGGRLRLRTRRYTPHRERPVEPVGIVFVLHLR